MKLWEVCPTCAQTHRIASCYTFKVAMTSRTRIILIAAACVVAAILFYLFFSLKAGPTFPGGKQPAPSGEATQKITTPQTLGGAIYEGAKNPIQNKLPDVNPVSNPVQGLYKNPFE